VKLLKRAAIVVVLLAVAGLYIAAGLFEVAPDEEAVVLRLGRYARTEGPGLRWRALGLEKLEKRQVTVTQTEEFGFRTVSPGPPRDYEERPEEKRMLTGDENVVDVEFVLQYRIVDLPKYLFAVQDVPQIIRDVAESAVREVVAGRPIDTILTEARGPIEDEAEILIQSLLDRYEAGIEVQNVQLQDVEPPDPVKDAFADVVTAKQDRERMILEAQGYGDQVVPQARGEAKKLVNQAQGYRDSEILEARGRADRFRALYEEYRKAPEVTRERLYLETLDEVLPGVEKVILEEGQADNVLPYLPLPRRGKAE
jgi:membrane protease subunit HflK